MYTYIVRFLVRWLLLLFLLLFFPSLTAQNWENSRYLVEKACVFHLNGISYRKDRSGFSGAGRVESIAHTYVSSSSSAFGLGKDFFSYFCCLYPSISTFAW